MARQRSVRTAGADMSHEVVQACDAVSHLLVQGPVQVITAVEDRGQAGACGVPHSLTSHSLGAVQSLRTAFVLLQGCFDLRADSEGHCSRQPAGTRSGKLAAKQGLDPHAYARHSQQCTALYMHGCRPRWRLR